MIRIMPQIAISLCSQMVGFLHFAFVESFYLGCRGAELERKKISQNLFLISTTTEHVSHWNQQSITPWLGGRKGGKGRGTFLNFTLVGSS